MTRKTLRVEDHGLVGIQRFIIHTHIFRLFGLGE